jgi:hypothetical protein
MERIPMKISLVLLAGALAAFAAGCGSGDGQSTERSSQALGGGDTPEATEAPPGGLLHVYARPDIRLCPSPACGGDWLVKASYHSACSSEPAFQYVTGVYAGDERVPPKCDALLVGTLVKDPDSPGYYRLELEL